MQESAPTIFVTGASGFVGRHIVQRLCGTGHHVRALVRAKREFDPSVQMVIGDLGRPETYAPALDGVSAVVHAALTDNLSDEPRATASLFDLAAQAGVRKFVHLSSIAIYGCPKSGTITEEAAPIPSRDAYSRTKLAIEEALKATSTGLEVSILRLGCVYGPGGGWWTGGLLNQMRHGNLILVSEGTGIANLVHVADVAALVSQVIQRSGEPFEVFNVTDGMPVSWRRYYEKLEELAGRKATVLMSADEAREHSRKWLRPSLARRVIRKLSGAPIIYPLGDGGVEYLASRAVYSNEKASRILHFVPEYDLERGLGTVRSDVSNQAAAVLSAS
jgi:nucleoside-diphosphate-sugar epimerase